MAIKDLQSLQHHVFLCNGGTCKQRGAEEITAHVRAELVAAGLHDSVHTTKTLCNGRCKEGPIAIVMPDNVWYAGLSETVASRIVAEHLAPGGAPVAEHLLFRWEQPAETRPAPDHAVPAPVRPSVTSA